MRSQKRPTLLIFLIVIVTVITAAAALRGSSSLIPPAQTNEEATPIKKGVMTGKQKRHSKLFSKFGTGKKIGELLIRNSDDLLIQLGTPMPGGDPGSPPLNRNRLLSETACGADAIIVGKVVSKDSQLTDNEEFIFTDYQIQVEDTLNNSSGIQVNPGDEITVTRPGGTIKLNNRIVKAVDKTLQPLSVGGHYVIFLQAVPETNSFKAVSNVGSFRLRNGKVAKFTEEPFAALFEEESANTLLTEIRNVIAGGCDR
ncbi:MAG: hypothetical protein H0T60_13635 [Acidobacteria bacterium]|nr:hypothetical protein [Acidobacteriota bacterium]